MHSPGLAAAKFEDTTYHSTAYCVRMNFFMGAISCAFEDGIVIGKYDCPKSKLGLSDMSGKSCPSSMA